MASTSSGSSRRTRSRTASVTSSATSARPASAKPRCTRAVAGSPRTPAASANSARRVVSFAPRSCPGGHWPPSVTAATWTADPASSRRMMETAQPRVSSSGWGARTRQDRRATVALSSTLAARSARPAAFATGPLHGSITASRAPRPVRHTGVSVPVHFLSRPCGPECAGWAGPLWRCCPKTEAGTRGVAAHAPRGPTRWSPAGSRRARRWAQRGRRRRSGPSPCSASPAHGPRRWGGTGAGSPPACRHGWRPWPGPAGGPARPGPGAAAPRRAPLSTGPDERAPCATPPLARRAPAATTRSRLSGRIRTCARGR